MPDDFSQANLRHPFNLKIYKLFLHGWGVGKKQRLVKFYYDRLDTNSLIEQKDINKYGFACRIIEIK